MTPLERQRAVYAARHIPGPAKAVLTCLAYHADEATLEAWPSLDTLAAEVGFGRTAVWNAVRALEAMGVITSVSRSEGRHSNRYRINVDKPSAWRTVQPTVTRTVREVNRSSGEREPAASRTSTCREVNPNQVMNQTGARKKISAPKFTPEDRATAEYIFGLLLRLHPTHKRPDFDAWADDVRLMRECDSRSDGDIRDLFAWANADAFWSKNILSPATLRRQWDKLAIKRGSGGRRQVLGAENILEGPA